MKSFLLIISIWGFTEENRWVYVGNQIVLDVLMNKEECMKLGDEWVWRQNNENYRLVVTCEEAILPENTPETKGESL
jgi:hypothetical protein